jgi:hypothetical protein
MKQSTVLKSPEEAIKGISDAYGNLDLKGLSDAEIVKMSVITSSEELTEGIKFLELLKNLPGAKAEELNLLKTDLFSIFKHKIALTKKAYGINGNIATIVPNPQLNLNLEDVQEVNESEEEKIEPEEQMAKTEVKDNVIKHDFNKKNKQADLKVINKDVDKVKNQKKEANNFKGYERKVIFGTPAILSETVQKLVITASTESEIDAIARHLVEEGKVEEALNMSIDLFEKSEVAKKSQQEVEKRFLNEILPWCHGVTTKPFEDFQNITLAFWNNHLIELSNSIRLVEEITQQAVEEMKAGQITATTAIKIHTDFPNDADKIFANVCKICNIEAVKIESAPMVVSPKKSNTEIPVTTVGLTYETLQNECISMFKANPDPKTAFKEVKAFFDKEIVNVVDEGFDKTDKGLFAKLVIEFKKSQKTVEEAEKAAYEGKDEIAPEVKNEAKSIVKKTIETGGYVLNELRKFFSQKAYRNTLGKKKIEEFAKELETEVKTENPELVNKSKERVKIMTNLSIENSLPDVWESAKLCKTFDEFKDLLINIVFEKKEITMIVKDKPKSINGWEVASNLMEQYGNNFEETKEWNSEKKAAFFNGIVNATSEERKKAKEATKVEESSENKQEQIELQRSESNTFEQSSTTETKEENKPQESKQAVDIKKFDAISTMSNTNKIHELMAEFLLLSEYKTYQDRFNELRDNYLPKNKKWSGTKVSDRENTINKVIKNNSKIQELVK